MPEHVAVPLPESATSTARRAGAGESVRPARELEREQLIDHARGTDAARQLQRCFPRWSKALDHLASRALMRLAANQPVDVNDPDMWASRDAQTQAVLRRHGLTTVTAGRLSLAAVNALVDGQAAADREAGLDWSQLTIPASRLDDRLRRAHARLPLDLQDPAAWVYREDQRRVLGEQLGVDAGGADDLSRWVLANPGRFDATDLQSWRIGSRTWLELADEQLEPVEHVARPVGLFVVPALTGDGWQLVPVLSLDAIRLFSQLGAQVERDLCSVVLRRDRVPELLGRLNVRTLHAGPRENLDSAGQLAQDLSRTLGQPVSPGVPQDKRDRWGRLHVSRLTYRTTDGRQDVEEIRLRVWTFHVRDFGQRRLGAQRIDDRQYGHGSAVMELGEAVQTAVERELPLLLSTEAAGQLNGMVRIGRMKGRPGMVTITSSDGLSATTRSVVAEQAVPELRELKASGAKVTLDAGARQVIRMVLAKPLSDDPVLLGKQREIAALKVVGSGVDASATGSGKTITTARAVAHRATVQPRFRGLLVAEGRLLGQWRDALTNGAPERGLPPLAPNVDVLTIDDDRHIAGQLRSFDRQLGERAGLVLAGNSMLDRYPTDFQAVKWHVLFADEALRLQNPATQAHQSFSQVRFNSAADAWLLTATPRGKSADTLDVLVGLAVGDQAMVTERLNTREAGDLLSELNAHRLRSQLGPYLVRITRKDMRQWLPEVLPAKAIAIDPDPALKTLLQAIRRGGRQAYQRLLEVLRELKHLQLTGQSGTALYKQALVELSRAQATVLGNVGVFVAASTEPASLLHSKAALAQALVCQGLVERALHGGGDGLPTLRSIVAETIAGVVGNGRRGPTDEGEQVLVFAERIPALRYLAETLRDRHGVNARVADGSLSVPEFEALKQAFRAGELDVLLLSPIGREGHDLQCAGTMLHYDLPWLSTQLEQRIGRVVRPGSKHAAVQTFQVYIRGGAIEHITGILAGRAAETHLLLDSYDGAHSASESTLGLQLGDLTAQVAEHKAQEGWEATAARLRVAAAVFGHEANRNGRGAQTARAAPAAARSGSGGLTAPRTRQGGHHAGDIGAGVARSHN